MSLSLSLSLYIYIYWSRRSPRGVILIDLSIHLELCAYVRNTCCIVGPGTQPQFPVKRSGISNESGEGEAQGKETFEQQ